MTITLPARFTSTHGTDGLPGFPAIDVFAPAGSLVKAGHHGVVTRLSGRARTGHERPGGAYGFSIYTRNSITGVTRFMTHLECVCLEVGERVGPRTSIGRVAAPPIGSRPGSDHVHLASTRP